MLAKVLKNSVLCLALASYASFGIFYSANSIEEVNKTIFSVNYNGPSYDSKYILSPYTGDSLSTTSGNNYYIFVHETYYLIENDDDPEFQDMTTRPDAFVCPNSYYGENYFTFNYTDATAKTIDIRHFGPRAGQAIFALMQEDNIASTNKLNCIVSLSNYSYVHGTAGDSLLEIGRYYDVDYAATFDIERIDLDNNLAAWRFTNTADERYFYHNGEKFVYGDGTEEFIYQPFDEEPIRYSYDTFVYAYQVSESLARELSSSVAAAYMNNAAANLRELYCGLPYFDKMEFYNLATNGNSDIGHQAGSTTDTSFREFGQQILNGIEIYKSSTNENYSNAIVDVDALEIDTTNAFIKGLSPFEERVSISVEGEASPTTVELFPQYLDDTRIGSSYKNPVLAIADNRVTNYYGKTLTLFYGDFNQYGDIVSSQGSEIEIPSFEQYVSQDGLQIQKAYNSNNEEVNCIFDGEIRFETIGAEGQYEYALVEYGRTDKWYNNYLGVNSAEVIWQSSPVFTKYQSYDDTLVDIDEESSFIGYYRLAAAGNNPASPVLGKLDDIIPANFDDGYIKRISVLNKETYDHYMEENQEIYSAFSNNEVYAIFNLDQLFNSIVGELQDLESKDSATGYLTVDGLNNAYALNSRLHELIYENVYSVITSETSERVYSSYLDAIGPFEDYVFDYDSPLEEELDALEGDFLEALINPQELSTIDEFCKTFINEFNAIVLRHPQIRSNLWDIFNTYYWNIYNSEVSSDAESIYETALAALKTAAGEN